jgi:hypothetical protein
LLFGQIENLLAFAMVPAIAFARGVSVGELLVYCLESKTVFSWFPPVHRADLKGQLRVEGGRSQSRL